MTVWPTAAVLPFTAVTARDSPGSGSVSLASTPGAATVRTPFSPTVAASFAAVGAAFTRLPKSLPAKTDPGVTRRRYGPGTGPSPPSPPIEPID